MITKELEKVHESRGDQFEKTESHVTYSKRPSVSLFNGCKLLIPERRIDKHFLTME